MHCLKKTARGLVTKDRFKRPSNLVLPFTVKLLGMRKKGLTLTLPFTVKRFGEKCKKRLYYKL